MGRNIYLKGMTQMAHFWKKSEKVKKEGLNIEEYVWGVDTPRVNVKNVKPKSLWRMKFIKNWKSSPAFIRFMLSPEDEYSRGYCHLMVELKSNRTKDKKEFYVVAFLSPVNVALSLKLPEWRSEDYIR